MYSKMVPSLIVAILAISLISVVSATPAVALSSNTGVFVPLYIYPGSAWQSVKQISAAHPSVPVLAVINPDSGPGASRDNNYVSGISTLHAAGVTVLGYVWTHWGARPIADVEADINSYHSWYAVDGIMFDEMSNVHGNEGYYSTLSQYAKSLGFSYTVGNPGADVPSTFLGTVDNIVIYENSGAPSLSYLQAHSSSPKADFSAVAYGVSTFDASYVRSASSYVKWISLTDDLLPNPYDTLPSYLSSLVTALDSQTPPPATVVLTVNSADLSSNPVSGMPVVIKANGTTVASGYTSLTYNAIAGAQYTVSASDYGSYVFDHWSTGSTSATITVSPTSSTTLTAYYRTPATQGRVYLNVTSVDLNGSSFGGMWTSIQSGGSSVASGYTPLSYSATSGTLYTVTVSNYGSYLFDHWSTGSTSATISVTPTSSTTLTACYSIPSTPTTVVLTVISADLSSNPVSGMPVVIKANGTTVASGYTSLTYGATAGAMYNVTASDYGSYLFDHWSTGSTSATISVTPAQATTLIAYCRPAPQSSVALSVSSSDLSGNPMSGMPVVIKAGTSTVASGHTPLVFNATSGAQYTITVSNYGSYLFDHWSTGSTSPTITLMPAQNTSLSAYCRPSPLPTVTLTVNSADSSGSPMTSTPVVIKANGTTVASGFTSLNYSAIAGAQYTVSVLDYGTYCFDHWNTGSTNSTLTVVTTQATSLFAYYRSTPSPLATFSINVNSADLAGRVISGLWAVVQSAGNTVASGYTSLTYTATSGAQYTITVSNYGSYLFDHWSTGSTNPAITVTPSSSATLTAYYRTPSQPTTVSLTVKSSDFTGKPISGLWVVIRTGGTTVASGYTPLSYSATSGTLYTVTVYSYGSYLFDHWSTGITSRSITVMPSQATTVIAYFRVLGSQGHH